MRSYPPIVPEDALNGSAVAISIGRAAIALARHKLDPMTRASDVVSGSWPRDRTAALITKGAVVSADTTSAAALVPTLIADFLKALGPISAGAQVLGAGLQLTFDRHGSISLPTFVADAANVAFVAEGSAIPVRQLAVEAPPQLVPRKLATVITLTAELIASSNAQLLVTDALVRSVGLGLDVALFDASPGDISRPAGLRNGVGTLTASANADPWAAMIEDIAAVAGAVAAVNGTAPVILAAAPARAIKMQLRSIRDAPLVVLPSSAIAGGDLIAIGPQALVSATADMPEVGVSMEAELVMNDQPLPVAPSGGPISQPIASLFQGNTVAIKLRLPAAWMLRDPRGVAWTTAMKW